jgi:hypothetical protein
MRLFDTTLNKDRTVAEMVSEVEGEKKVLWNWRRNLFHWKQEIVEVCNGLVLGAERRVGASDIWKWGDSSYSIKEAYMRLTEEDDVEVVVKKMKIIYSSIARCYRLFGKRH